MYKKFLNLYISVILKFLKFLNFPAASELGESTAFSEKIGGVGGGELKLIVFIVKFEKERGQMVCFI